MMRGIPRWRLLAPSLGFLSVAALAPVSGAEAQQAISIAPGTRVRVRAANLVAPLVANFLQMRGDTAVFIEDAAGRGVWSLHVSDITRLERSDGEQKSNTPYIIRGAAIGAGVGAVGGLLIASSLKPSDSGKKYSRGLSGGAGAVVGGIIGAVIGSRFGSERWTNVSLPRRLSVLPDSRGLGLRVGFNF